MWSVNADYGKIKAAITYRGGKEGTWLPFGPIGDHPLSGNSFVKADYDGMISDLKDYSRTIRENTSATVFDVKELLAQTLEAWREDKKRLKEIILGCFPEFERNRIENLIKERYWADVSAGEIFGEKCPLIDDEKYEFGIRPVKAMPRVADLGHMTSEGFIAGNMSSWSRSRENLIMNVIIENHPTFIDNMNVVANLDGEAYLAGSDIVNINEDTLAIGVGSYSTKKAATEISKALPDKKVYVVKKYPEHLMSHSWVDHYGERLNYMFNMIDRDKALIQPYIFDYPTGSRKVLMNMLQTLSDDLYRWEPVRKESDFQEENWAEIPDRVKPRIKSRVYGSLSKERLKGFDGVGSVEVLEDGKSKSKNSSFVDQLIEDAVLSPENIILVGGDPNDVEYRNEYEHWITSIREGGWACALTVLKPGVVMSYHDMVKTNEILEYNGVEVIEKDARYVKMIHETGLGSFVLPLWRV
ncbi:MAG: arginine deiminase family protein [Candidatus Thorarchaeota archaeon]